MKALLTITLLTVLSQTSYAHPGGSKLACKSDKTFISLVRSNGVGWFSPVIKARVNGRTYTMTTPDEMQNYGETFHNSPLKVIRATATVPFEVETVNGDISVTAMPDSVKSFGIDGEPTVWSLEAEKDECNDVNGSAVFKGIIRGVIYNNGEQVLIDTQIMDCKLTYNSGMSC